MRLSVVSSVRCLDSREGNSVSSVEWNEVSGGNDAEGEDYFSSMEKHRMAPFVEEDLDEDEGSTAMDIAGRCANEHCFDFSTSSLNRRWMDRRRELSVSSIDAEWCCWSLSKGNRRDWTLNSVH